MHIGHLDAVQAAPGEHAEWRRSRRSWLGETDIHAKRLATAMAVDPDGG
jgi:hypothetical protein